MLTAIKGRHSVDIQVARSYTRAFPDPSVGMDGASGVFGGYFSKTGLRMSPTPSYEPFLRSVIGAATRSGRGDGHIALPPADGADDYPPAQRQPKNAFVECLSSQIRIDLAVKPQPAGVYSGFTERAGQSRLGGIGELYTLVNPDAVRRYLFRNDDLVDLLLRIRANIAEYAPEYASFGNLRLEHHSGIEEDWECLVIYVNTGISDLGKLATTDKGIFESCFEHQAKKSKGRLILDVG